MDFRERKTDILPLGDLSLDSLQFVESRQTHRRPDSHTDGRHRGRPRKEKPTPEGLHYQEVSLPCLQWRGKGVVSWATQGRVNGLGQRT